MTEKNLNPKSKQIKTLQMEKAAKAKVENPSSKTPETKIKENSNKEKNPETKKISEVKETKKEIKQKKASKKTEVIVNGKNFPISTKYSGAICKFIKNKRIGDAIRELEEVLIQKKAIPMKGEIPHRKGKIMSGRYPKKAASYFIMLLKNLASNANTHEVEDPIIFEAIPNIGQRPQGRFGSIRRKRTHIKIVAIDKKNKLKKRKK
jgi:ribosomal protein L22